METTLQVHSWLRRQGIRPDRLAMAGDSCGAILVFGALQRLRAAGESLPAAVMILSGWLDLALTGTSYERNRGRPDHDRGWRPAHAVRLHAVGGAIGRIVDYLACPWVLAAATSVVVDAG